MLKSIIVVGSQNVNIISNHNILELGVLNISKRFLKGISCWCCWKQNKNRAESKFYFDFMIKIYDSVPWHQCWPFSFKSVVETFRKYDSGYFLIELNCGKVSNNWQQDKVFLKREMHEMTRASRGEARLSNCSTHLLVGWIIQLKIFTNYSFILPAGLFPGEMTATIFSLKIELKEKAKGLHLLPLIPFFLNEYSFLCQIMWLLPARYFQQLSMIASNFRWRRK